MIVLSLLELPKLTTRLIITKKVFSVASHLISKNRASLGTAIAGKALFLSQNWDSWEPELDFLGCVGDDN